MVRKQTILVVDDDYEMGVMLSDFLKKQGYAVFTAPSAVVALKMVLASPPDLVLSDVVMGTMSGIELATKLHTERPNLPVVLFSSFENNNIVEDAKASGAKGYLKKPFSLTEVAHMIKTQLHTKG